MKNKEQTLFSGITLGISDQSLDLSIFNMGKLLGTTVVSRSISISDDLLEGLSRLTTGLESFPPRIILYNQKESELEEIKNSLNEIDWEKVETLKFMHAPKIEILNPTDKILAVSLAGGSEIGQVENVSYNDVALNNSSQEEVSNGLKDEEDSSVVEDNSQEISEDEIKNIEEPVGVTAADLGFVVDKPSFIPKANLPKIGNFPKMPKINLKLPKLPKFNFTFSGKPFIFGGISFFVILIIGFLMWWFLPKATVTIFVSPKKIEDNIDLSFGTELSADTIETSLSAEKTKSTTGTKTVGEKAKGQVKIQNGTAFPINLTAGTILLSSTDLRFVTIKQASVSGALSPSDPGTAVLDIEAANIGSEYNLAKDEIFKVGNYPKAEVDALVTSNLTGGSSRQISAVSEDDRKKLLDELTEELTTQAKSKLNDQISEEKMLIDSSIVTESIEEDFSNKVGDEATTVKLSLEIKFTAKVVSKSDLSKIAKNSLEQRIPSGFILRDDQISYTFSDQEKDNFTVKVVANLLPSIDTADIAKKIAGRYPSVAESYLQSVPGFANAEFRLPPLLRGKLATLPHVSKNIEVILSSEQ